MKSFYKNKSNMREDFIKNEQDKMMKETLKDSRRIPVALSRNTLIKIEILVFIIIFIMLLGGIKLRNKSFYDMQFDISITGVDVRSTVHTEFKKVYVPYMFYSADEMFGIYNRDSIEFGETYNRLTDMGVYILKVTSYRCYYINDDIKLDIGCSTQDIDSSIVEDPHLITRVKNSKVEYTGLKIIDRGHDNTVVYDGEFVNNLSPYIYKPSRYAIFIYANYKNAKATVSTTIDVGDDLNEENY